MKGEPAGKTAASAKVLAFPQRPPPADSSEAARKDAPWPMAPALQRETIEPQEEGESPQELLHEPRSEPNLQSAPRPQLASTSFFQKPVHFASAYMAAAVFLSLAQGLGLNFISANITQIQGSFGVTTNEANWLVAAYMAPNASLTLILFKGRQQYGLRNFAEWSILLFVAVSVIHLFVNDFQTALVLRFFAGAAASPMSSLGFLYMLEPFPPARKMNIGLCFALANLSMAAPVARLISPTLLDIGGWHALYMLEVAVALIALAFVYILPLTPIPHAKVISFPDVASYFFIAVGFGALAIVLSVGRLYWWTEAPWLGVLLVVAITAITIATVIELNRKAPFIDVHWLASREILHLTAVLIIFRVALTEQSSGAANLFTQLGLSTSQTNDMWAAILFASIAAGTGLRGDDEAGPRTMDTHSCAHPDRHRRVDGLARDQSDPAGTDDR